MRRIAVAATVVLILAVAAVAAAIRLAPLDAAAWHRATETLIPAEAAEVADPTPMPRGAYARRALPGSPAAVLERLYRVAMATPRTRRLAGSAADGRITWVTRSAFWGFPDITTASAATGAGGTILTLAARQRFGVNDAGVNAARLRVWLAAL